MVGEGGLDLVTVAPEEAGRVHAREHVDQQLPHELAPPPLRQGQVAKDVSQGVG